MIPLGGFEFPTDAEKLATALRDGLRQLIQLPDEASAISVASDRLVIDLTGAKVLFDEAPRDTIGNGQTQPGPRFQLLEAFGHPLYYQGAGLEFDVSAVDVQFLFDRTKSGSPVMVLDSAQNGKLTARISRLDFERLVTAKVAAFAQASGIDVERINFGVTQLGPRSLQLDAKAHVQTKALFKMIRGAVILSGRLDIDDKLVARASGLQITGEGTMIGLAVNMYRGKVLALEGKEFPLTDWALGGVQLRNLELQVGDDFGLSASFGT